MKGVGVPGGPRAHGYRTGRNKAKQAEYRHSEAGRMARQMYLRNPEVKARLAIIRAVKKKMKGGF